MTHRLALAAFIVVLPGLLFWPPIVAKADNPVEWSLCAQPPLTATSTLSVTETPPSVPYAVYLPLILKPAPLPPCTSYCGLQLTDDPYRPPGYQTYFADEFNCGELLDYWVVQPQMTAASYTPPATGYVTVANGTLQIGVPGREPSFPYLYLIDDSATSYDVPHDLRRVDWLPNTGNFRLAMRVRFNVETLGEHRISIYADGHRPGYAGPLFYIGSDYNAEEEAWRGLIVGANRGQSFIDLGELGYRDPYTGWVVLTVDFDTTADLFTLAVDGAPLIRQPLSSFKGVPQAATRPDILYLGSLALLQEPVPWTDIELDWLRVYAPITTAPATYGLLVAAVENAPTPGDALTPYAAQLPAGPFANTPHWVENFDDLSTMPISWTQITNPDPANSWTVVENGYAKLLNSGWAGGVPVWAVFDEALPVTILAEQTGSERESPAEYLARRGGSPFVPTDAAAIAGQYPRLDWRPAGGNIRFAWRGFQGADGYGVEISNVAHGDWGSTVYFTGAMFYTLLDITTPGGGQFIFPSCQEQYFWRLHLLPQYKIKDTWATINADYINGTVHLYANGQPIGWWPESDCSLNWYLKGENATSPEVLFFGNPATAHSNPGGWSEVHVDWFATFPGLPRVPPL